MSQADLRDEFLATLHHIDNVLTKVTQNSGPHGFLSAPDLHKIAEGLFEWSDYNAIVSRANEFLGAGNRFIVTPLPRRGDLDLLKRVRNAVAHRTDRAWESFLSLCRSVPFSIPPARMRGITPGRFLVTHTWNGQPVLRNTIAMLAAAARHLVP